MEITGKQIETLKRFKLYTPARGAYNLFTRISRRLFHGPVILVYHRVTRPERDPFLLSVNPENFREQMEYLSKNYRVISLNELKQNVAADKLDPKSAAVTFDDGYADNFDNARPVLEQLNIPATIFIVTGRIGSNKELWWDALERLLLGPEVLPGALELTVRGKKYQWQVKDTIFDKYPDLKWNTARKPLNARQRLFLELHALLRTLDDAGQEEALFQIARWAAAPPPSEQVPGFMSAEELKMLAGGGLIDIGAHTVTHPVLSAQPPETQYREIFESKQRLEEILERPVTAFAYPYGSYADIGRETIDMVREAGFGAACANFPDYVKRHTDPLLFPRWVVRDWDVKEFASRLKGLRT